MDDMLNISMIVDESRRLVFVHIDASNKYRGIQEGCLGSTPTGMVVMTYGLN